MKKTYFICLQFFFLTLHTLQPTMLFGQTLPAGNWKGTLQLQKIALPFEFEVQQSKQETQVHFVNGIEKLAADKVVLIGDTVKIKMEIFDSELIAVVKNKELQGEWVRYGLSKPYRVPFSAVLVEADKKSFRFFENPTTTLDFSGKWESNFLDEKGEIAEKLIGVFDQKGSKLTGTFLSTTGDYRFLAGEVNGNEMYLSTFDGSHAYVFKAAQQADGTIKGEFFAGISGYQTWTATRNNAAALPDVDKLTFLKEGYEKLAFSFPNLGGKQVSLADEKFKGKVVIVQLLGSWCPNCMDETAFLAPYFKKHKKSKLAIIGLAFERSPKFEEAKVRVEKLVRRFDIQYDMLIAGINDKQKAAQALPMLSAVLAFPTTIYIDKKGKVRKIHTGFSGPGTGEHYDKFVKEFELLIEKMLSE
jgi:thiol-disulfide isomerase/thioredoxin